MSRLYKFVIKDERIKSLEDFMTQSQDGLSPTLSKGYLSVKRRGDLYEMYFTAGHPLKLRQSNEIVCYSKYPNVAWDTIFYYIAEPKPYEGSLPLITHKNKNGKKEVK